VAKTGWVVETGAFHLPSEDAEQFTRLLQCSVSLGNRGCINLYKEGFLQGHVEMTERRWKDGANLLLGAWLLASPWVLDYAGTGAALNAYTMGAAILVVALIAAYMPEAWEEIINTLIGVWLVMSPFVLSYVSTKIALHTVIVGILATAFAIWAMSNDRRFYQRWQRTRVV
jgi:hypothetical protein